MNLIQLNINSVSMLNNSNLILLCPTKVLLQQDSTEDLTLPWSQNLQCAGEWDKLLYWQLFHSAGYCPPYRLEYCVGGGTNNKYAINHDIALHIDWWIVLEGGTNNEYSMNQNMALHIDKGKQLQVYSIPEYCPPYIQTDGLCWRVELVFHTPEYCPPCRLMDCVRGWYSINQRIDLHIDYWIIFEDGSNSWYSINQNTGLHVHVIY